MTSRLVDIEIHKDAIVPCALLEFKMRRAVNCAKCQYFAGVGEISSEESLPWNKRYIIRCGHFIERRTHILEVVEE